MKKIIICLFFGVLLLNLISAQISYCCEKTTYGAWCINDDEENCAPDFSKSATSCESTDYCREGCCYDSQEGTCTKNTPQRICNANNGKWDFDPDCEIPQCELGCCLIGNQAAFVTKTRCKRLSNLYGLEINFKTTIGSELECVMSTTSDVEGACVFEEEFELTCKRMTQKECQSVSNSSFYEGKLCSAEELGTNCAPSQETTCVEGEDQVYYLDTCGNLANIYDASKYNNKNYWAEIKSISEVCGVGQSNANSAICGNCDYFLGSTCREYDRARDSSSPTYGDYICRDLGCEYKGTAYEHGESWCEISGQKDFPGSRYFRLLCYDSEVLVEPCADFRQETCLQGYINDFSVGACLTNRWQDCAAQENLKDCLNTDKRDCIWHEKKDVCVPKYAPGYKFWVSGDDAGERDLCELGDSSCEENNENIFGWQIRDSECDSSWKNRKNDFCNLLGDCGVKENYIGENGFYKINDLVNKE